MNTKRSSTVLAGARGEVPLVYSSTFVAELSVADPVPEWNHRELRFALEQAVAFTPAGVYFLDGRQTRFHLIRRVQDKLQTRTSEGFETAGNCVFKGRPTVKDARVLDKCG